VGYDDWMAVFRCDAHPPSRKYEPRRIDELASLDKAQLKARYKEQLRKPREDNTASGAGLGLIDIARKSSEPLKASLQTVANGRSFISLSAVI